MSAGALNNNCPERHLRECVDPECGNETGLRLFRLWRYDRHSKNQLCADVQVLRDSLPPLRERKTQAELQGDANETHTLSIVIQRTERVLAYILQYLAEDAIL